MPCFRACAHVIRPLLLSSYNVGFAASLAFENKDNVVFQNLAKEYGGGLGGSDCSGGLNFQCIR